MVQWLRAWQPLCFHPEFPQAHFQGKSWLTDWWSQHPLFDETAGHIFHSQGAGIGWWDSPHRSPTHRKWPLMAHYANDAPLPLTSASPSFLSLWQCWIKQNAPSHSRLKTCSAARDYLCSQASWERDILTETLASVLSCIWYFWENINLCLSSVVPDRLTNIIRASSNKPVFTCNACLGKAR